MHTTPFLAALAAITEPGACLTAASDIERFTTDYRRLYKGGACAVVLPRSTEEVQRVMALCHAHRVAVVPQGGNTSLMGGAVPAAPDRGVLLNLQRMNRVLDVDTVGDTMTVQAGVTLNAARKAAEDADRLFPLRIGSEGTCQIGGNLATNAGGTAVLRYGNMRDLVLGLEVVLPDGRVLESLRRLRKDNTGYDLKNLFVGSEGTLGIITAAVLKLMPRPTAASVALVAVAGPAAAVRLLAKAKQLAGPAVTAWELISAPAMALVLEYLGLAHPLANAPAWMVLVELTGGGPADQMDASLSAILEAGLEEGLVLDAAMAASLSDQQRLWRIREEISDAQTRTGGSIKCDVSVPLASIASFVEQATALVLRQAPEARMIIYGHMGDGNVHFNPLRPADQPAEAFLHRHYETVSREVDGLASSMGGSISAEHGIGVAKRDVLPLHKSPVEMDLMRALKAAIDPLNLLNPGKVLAI